MSDHFEGELIKIDLHDFGYAIGATRSILSSVYEASRDAWMNAMSGGGYTKTRFQLDKGLELQFNNPASRGKTYAKVVGGPGINAAKLGEINVKQTAYDAVVIRTKQVPAGEGVNTAVEQNEVVYATPAPFLANNDAHAQQIVSALALKTLPDLDLSSTLQPITILVRKF